MYADDLVVLSLSLDDLQIKLNNLKEYCQEWGLEVNRSKTKVMVFAKYGHKQPTRNIYIGSEPLEWVSSYKYLGIEVHNNGNMTNSSKNLCKRSWKAIYMLNASLKNINVKPSTRLSLFDRLVCPILHYNSEVWGTIMNLPENKRNEINFWKKMESLPFEMLHIRYMKIIMGVHSKATNAAVRGELGRYPIGICIVKNMLKYWDHLEDDKYNNPILKEAKNECNNLIDINGTWFNSMKQIFDIFDIRWMGTRPNNWTKKQLIKKMRTSYENYWKNNIGDVADLNGKLSTYRKIKSSFRKEKYLDAIRDTKNRKAMSAFRISAHRLEIESYRYQKNIPRNERFCSLCTPDNKIHIGDEFHAMMVCEQFKRSRDKLFEMFYNECKHWRGMDLEAKFVYVMSYEGPMLNDVAIFIREVLSVSRNIPVWYIWWDTCELSYNMSTCWCYYCAV